MLRLKHSPDNNWTRYGDLSLSGAAGAGPIPYNPDSVLIRERNKIYSVLLTYECFRDRMVRHSDMLDGLDLLPLVFVRPRSVSAISSETNTIDRTRSTFLRTRGLSPIGYSRMEF